MRKKDYEDEVLLKHLHDFWEKECHHDPQRLRYTELSEYLKHFDINFTDNALKHRPAIHDTVNQLKGKVSAAIPEKSTASKEPGDLSDLSSRYLKLLDLYIETFSEQFCLKHLVEEGLIDEQEFDLKPNFVKEAIITANQKPFENKFVKKIMAIAGLTEDEEAEETKEEEMESEINL